MHALTRLFYSLLISSALFFTLLFFTFVVQAGQVDINSADAATLASALNGVGEQKAETIVAYREMHGPFGQIEDLANVKGIGNSTIEKNRENLSVGPVATP